MYGKRLIPLDLPITFAIFGKKEESLNSVVVYDDTLENCHNLDWESKNTAEILYSVVELRLENGRRQFSSALYKCW